MSSTHFSEVHLGGDALSPSKHENRQSNDHLDTCTCSKHQRRTDDPISKENVEPSAIDADPFGKLSDNTSEIFAESKCDADPFAKFFSPSGIFAEPNGQHFINTQNLFARYIDCKHVNEIPPDLDQFDELATVQERHPKSRMIFDISNRLGLRDDGSSKHPVVFGGSLGALGSITSLALINFPPLTNRDQITKCHCWQKDGKLGEGCLQIIVDWAVDILVHAYDKDRDVSEKLVRSCWGFVDINPIAGPADWHYNPHTQQDYLKVLESVKDPSEAILRDLVKTLPNLKSVVVFGDLPFEYAIKENWFPGLTNQPTYRCLCHPLQAKMHVMAAEEALAWANSLSHSLAAAMGCEAIEITLDILTEFYVPARERGEKSHDNMILSGILRVGGLEKVTTKGARKLRSHSSLDGSVATSLVEGVKMLTNASVSKDTPDILEKCIDIVRNEIDSKMDVETEIDSEMVVETADSRWTEAQDQQLLELEHLLRGHPLVRILLSVAFKGKTPTQCGERAKKARYDDIARRLADLEEVSEGDIKFHAEYEAARAKDNERKSELYYANKARYDEIGSKDREELTEEEEDFLSKYEADRAKANEYDREWRSSNKARSEDITRRLAARDEVTEEEKDFLAKCEADRAKANERWLKWYYANKARRNEIQRKDREEYNAMRDDEMQSLLLNPDHQKQQLRNKRKAILQLKRICRPKMLEVDLVLNVSPGRLGLTVNSGVDIGLEIIGIQPACTFAHLVDIGDRIVIVGDKVVRAIEDLQINANRDRIFGIMKRV